MPISGSVLRCPHALAWSCACAVEHGQVIHRSSGDTCINPQAITCRRCHAVAVVADLSLAFATLDSLMPLMTGSAAGPPPCPSIGATTAVPMHWAASWEATFESKR
jgi:hypothetical protein